MNNLVTQLLAIFIPFTTNVEHMDYSLFSTDLSSLYYNVSIHLLFNAVFINGLHAQSACMCIYVCNYLYMPVHMGMYIVSATY